jgi:hypothetical protein
MSAEQGQHPAKRAKGAAKQPTGQQLKQKDDNNQQPFHGKSS